MRHFNIIQLYRDGENSKLDFFDCIDDPLIETETDFVNDTAYEGEERKEAIARLKEAISPFADVDIDNETLTFHDKQTVEEQYVRHVKAAAEMLQKKFAEKKYTIGRKILEGGIKEWVKKLTCGDLFFCDGCGQTLSSILTDYLGGYMPETLHIGDIFDAHN